MVTQQINNKLPRAQWDDLDIQYQRTPAPDEAGIVSGEHYALTMLLNKFGYYPMSREEAMQITERLLSNGWEEEN